jgi:hypothetical protein
VSTNKAIVSTDELAMLAVGLPADPGGFAATAPALPAGIRIREPIAGCCPDLLRTHTTLMAGDGRHRLALVGMASANGSPSRRRPVSAATQTHRKITPQQEFTSHVDRTLPHPA